MASIENIVLQMILSAFRSAQMSSASPGKVNRFMGLENAGALGVMDIQGEIETAILELVGEGGTQKDPSDLAQDLLDAEEKKKKKGTKEKQATGLVSRTISNLSNPVGIVSQAIPFLPHAALIALAVGLAPFIFDILTKPGGPLDLRFKRIVDDEINAFLSRQAQKDTEMGIRQVIIQSRKGFTASNAENSFNTMRGIREGGLDKERLDRLAMVDHAKGVFDFG